MGKIVEAKDMFKYVLTLEPENYYARFQLSFILIYYRLKNMIY